MGLGFGGLLCWALSFQSGLGAFFVYAFVYACLGLLILLLLNVFAVAVAFGHDCWRRFCSRCFSRERGRRGYRVAAGVCSVVDCRVVVGWLDGWSLLLVWGAVKAAVGG